MYTLATADDGHVSFTCDVTTRSLHLPLVIVRCCQFGVQPVAEGVEISLLLCCLYLSYRHRVKDRCDQFAAREPSDRHGALGREEAKMGSASLQKLRKFNYR
jgi:hypothetical protein